MIAERVASRYMKQALRNAPRSVEDWELYSKPGASVAAKELTSALMKARDEMMRILRRSLKGTTWVGRDAKIESAMYAVYEKFLDPIMDKFSDLGAGDTEPRVVAQEYLIDTAKESFPILRYAGEKKALYDSARNAREGQEDLDAALRLLRSAHAFWTERGNPPPGIGAEGFESTRDANSTVARMCNAIEDALRLLSGPYRGLRV